MKRIKARIVGRRVMAFILCLCMVSSLISGMGLFRAVARAAETRAASGGTSGVIREADPSTMDDYQKMLDFSADTRSAGRLWTDKTVFALSGDATEITKNAGDRGTGWNGSTLTLTETDDGVDGTVTLNDDFLHVFSALGSSLQLDESVPGPFDLVILLDMSGSMAAMQGGSDLFKDSRIAKVLDSINEAIDYLMKQNKVNQVAVIAYGTTAYTLMELGHYKPKNDNSKTYLTVTNFTNYGGTADISGNGAYTVNVTAQKEGELGNESTYAAYEKSVRNAYQFGNRVTNQNSTVLIGYHTNLQAGIWQAFNELYNKATNEKAVTYTYTSKLTGETKTVPRIPVAFVMTDGGSNLALGDADSVTGDEWHNVPIKDNVRDDLGDANWYTATANRKYRSESGSYKGSGVILDILLTASYMKSKVQNKYTDLITKAGVYKDGQKADFQIHTVSVDTPDAAWQVPRVYATLDPKDYFNESPDTNVVKNQVDDIKNAYSDWQTWITTARNKPGTSITTHVDDVEKGAGWSFNINTLSTTQETTEGVTNEDVIANINYNDTFADIVASDLTDKFTQLLDDISRDLFTPVNGANDMGIGDSVTYTDPIGKYMEVKDVQGLSLFGHYYDIVKTAVYDYQWNDTYIGAMAKKDPSHYTQGKTELPAGWYKGEPTEDSADGVEYSGGPTMLPNGMTTAEQAWAAGWVYRVGYKTAAQFVPTLSDINSPGMAEGKERQTVYTFYRLDKEDGEALDENQRRTTLRMNPAYGESVPAGVAYNAETQEHLNTPGVYALSDLRIWVEDTGDWNDESASGGVLGDANYDEALWVNVPVNMLPLRTVKVIAKRDDAPQGTPEISYETNLTEGSAGYSASFPLRVFYTVGVAEDALEASRRVNIAGGISPEYIDKNKAKTAADALVRGVQQGDVEFFSNWYNPLNRYTDYATSSTDYTYGDPVVSFSPSAENRFYIFEKALPLYSTAYVWVAKDKEAEGKGPSDGDWKKVTINETGTNEGTVNYLPTEFGGRLLAQDLVPVGNQGTSEERQSAIWNALNAKSVYSARDGDIILLDKHRLTDVTKPTEPNQTDPFKSESYFYMPIEYYTLGADGKTATPTQYVVTRKGSEFGSAYSHSNISNGDMLVWHDRSGQYPDYPYLSATDTGDDSRGKDYIGWPLDATGYYAGLTKGDKNRPYVDNDQAQAAYTDALGKLSQAEQGNYAVNWTDQRAKVMENVEKGDWVLCAKPGGLRVGDLAQNMQTKDGNFQNSYNNNTGLTARVEDYYKDRYSSDAENLTWGYYENNVTRTANNYYVPTISSSSDSEGGNSIIVNVYLGNNGRLRVPDTTLMVSKLVESNNPMMPIDENKEFNYQVYINGFTGPADAIVLHYNEATKSWQRQFHYIDLTLDKQLFLQTQDGQKAMVDSKGERVIAATDGGYVYASDGVTQYVPKSDGGPYYVFIGKNEVRETGMTDTGFRVYHNEEVDGNGSVDRTDVIIESVGGVGTTGTFFATTVGLVSLNKYANTWQAEEGAPDPVNDPEFKLSIYLDTKYSDTTLERFELLSIDPNINAETSEIAIDTPYLTSSAYWTRTVYFGYDPAKIVLNEDGSFDTAANANAKLGEGQLYDKIIPTGDRPDYFSKQNKNTTNEEIAANTAEFTLKHGEALLFRGIPSNTVYRVTEQLTEKDVADGYNLKEVSHNQQVGSTSTYRPGTQSIPVYYKDGTTYGWYGGGAYPDTYDTYKTENGLMWALSKDGQPNTEVEPQYEPFHHTNAVVWESYSTMDKDAKGDNHHQPAGVPKGSSTFWLWDETSGTSTDTKKTHTVGDNPSCKSLEEGGCDEAISNTQVRHYFFKDGELKDLHYQGEGSGYIRNIGRYITSPTAHFAVEEEKTNSTYATTPMPNFAQSTDYTGAYSIFGNTGTFEESANYVNTQNTDKQETHINGEEIPNTGSNMKPGVQEGDTITYSMKWGNSNENAAEVWIYDKLDEGVDFVSAKWDNYTLNAVPDKDGKHQNAKTTETVTMTRDIEGLKQPVTVPVIRYDATEHAVTWNLGSQNASASGEVTLTVKVNKNAKQYWDYDMDGVGDAPVGDNDDLVRNRATVHVGNNQWDTNTLVNPVGGPDKTETAIDRGGDGNNDVTVTEDGGANLKPKTDAEGNPVTDANGHPVVEGPLVYVGDKITYEIEWENYSDQDALITVRDPIDKNVRVISASFNPADTKVRGEDGVVDKELKPEDPNYKGAKSATLDLDDPTLTGDQRPASKRSGETVNVSTTATAEMVPVIRYDAGVTSTEDEYVSEGQVTWNLGVQPAGATGKVTLVVEVLSTATPVGQVDNTSYVQVGNDRELQTKTIENPTPEVSKTETQINGETTAPSGDDPSLYPRVKVGDTITYQIDWNQNDMPTLEEGETVTTVTVVDPLDPGVDFESASYTIPGEGGQTVTLSKGQNKAESTATVTVKAETKKQVTIAYDEGTHTVTWTINGEPEDIGEGEVHLTVKVTTRALVNSGDGAFTPGNEGIPGGYNDNWGYRDEGGIESDGQLVQNRGAVNFGNGSYLYTELVKNPTGPEKEEVTPGDGKQVQIGQHITYEISYQNYLGGEQQIIIRDPLDVGVDFVQAKFGDKASGEDWVDLDTAKKNWDELASLDNGTVMQAALKDPTEYITGKNMPDILVGIYYDESARVVYWVLTVEENVAGEVTLEVEVNEKAHEYWQYGDATGDHPDTPDIHEDEKDHEVVDRASVQVGNDAKVYTNIPENPVPEKTLAQVDGNPDVGTPTPSPESGDKGHGGDIDVYQSVFEGQELTYNIHWKNGTDKNADVVVTDQLDLGRNPCGVDFVSASYTIPGDETVTEKVTLKAPGRQPATSTAQGTSVSGGQPRPLVTIAYNTATRTVTWTILNQAPGAEGDVVLTVRVNANANVLHEVDNEAQVTVGNDSQYTNIVENPTEKPEKTETHIDHETGDPEDVEELTPGENDDKLHGPLVYVGDQITYQITWSNYESEEAIVTVRDPLDPNVEFVSASFDPTYTEGGDDSAKAAELKNGRTESDTKVDLSGYGGQKDIPVITYDEKTHTVTWNLGVQPARQKGTVTLVVKVLSSASPVGYVDNTAYVKVGDNPEQETDTIENPTPEVNKTETQINGEATEPSGSDPSLYPRVDVGDTITYKISWDRHEHPADEELAMVTVTDPLDPGVDFVSASYNGVTLDARTDDLSVGVHSSTWVPDDDGSEPPEGQTEKGHWSIRIFYDKATHTVTWTLYGDDALDEGYVELTVKVTTRALFDEDTDNSFNNNKENLPGGADKAGDNWDYRDKDGIESGEGGSDLTQLVQNRGAVKFGNDADIYTQLVKNPVGPEKTEVTPGDGEQVAIGDHITYEISYTNYHPAEAGKVTEQIIIRDPLDAGVDFVRAKGKAGTWVLKETAGTNWTGLTEDQKNALKNPATYMTGHDNKMPEIEAGVYYDADNHVVYWVLKADPGEKGAVTLEVKVNKDAAKEWHYGPNGDDDNGHVEGQKDYEVVDRASVQVGNDSKIYTNVVENPVPDKDEKMVEGEPVETKPKEGADDTEVGPTVKVGDQITYEIGFRNDRDVPVDIVIRDELDPGVEFVSASYGGVTAENASDRLTARSEKVTPLDGEPYWPVTVSYDRDSRTVTWTLKNVAPGAYTVALVVEVTSKAVKAGVVDNQAEVQIGNSNVKTDIVENPTPKTVKTETSPGQGMIVRPGEEVEYAISWRNHKPDSAKVVITDCLDPGVDFRSASIEGYTGNPLTFAGPDNPTGEQSVEGTLTVGEATIPVTIKYDPVAHTITWTLGTDTDGADGVPAGYEGKVTFTVVVNKKAFDKYEYNNEAEPKKGEGEDNQILNQGSVKVGNDLTYTEIVDNPLKPEKKETAIDDVEVQVGETGPKVKVGDFITYTISWRNNAREGDDPIPADVIVTDQLGVGLEFVDAGFVVFDADGKLTYPTGKPDGYGDCSVSSSGRTVTWTLPGREENATGMVWIRARVTSDAVNVVTNTGSVYDGSNTWTLPQITNPVDSGLIIEKVVENGDAGDITKQWHFTVALTAPAGQDIPWGSITWKLVGGDSEPEVFIDAVEGTISFTLRHGEYLSLSGLPNGTHYEVVEEEANVSPYTTRVDEEHDPAVGATKDGVQTWVRFVNKRSNTPPPPPGPETVELTVDKTVVGEKGDTERLWHFTVTLDRPLTGWYGDMYFTNGVADFTLKHGQSVTATGLPEGVQYTVTEAEANADGYVTDSQGASGTLNGSNYAHFINKLGDEEHDHELVVEKTVTGALGDRNREWHFRVELSQPLTGWYGNMYFANGVAEFTLKDGESRYATGLPAGVTYTVTEAEANRDGYTTETSGETGTIPDGGTAKAWFVNSKDETPSTEPDDTTPEPDNPPETPETGDNSQLGLWAMLMILSLAGVATTSFSLFGSAKWRIASFKGKHLRK